MRTNPVKKNLHKGGTALGTMVFEFATTGIARLVAGAGAEFVIFDMEHTGWTMETVRLLMATSHGQNFMPMVRVPATEYHFLARALDMGAMGLMVPMVESADQARLIVQSTKYPPAGRRGAAFRIAHDHYEDGDAVAKMRSANEEVLLIAQIETVAGLDNLEGIAAVPGIDVLWIGHNDLTNSMGIPGQFEHPRYLEAVQKVLDAARGNGKTAGFMAPTIEMGMALLRQGFRILAYGGDLWIYQQALRDGIGALRFAVGHGLGSVK